MVESKSVVFQMIPHTLFIEWDFWTLFTTLFTSRFEVTVHIYGTIHVYGTVHIYGTIHTTSFFFKCSFLDLFNLKFYT